MITKQRSYFEIKVDTLFRLIISYTLTSQLPVYIVNEYPKSGGTWLAQMLSSYLELPFYRNRLPKFTPQILHSHYRYSPRLNNIVNVIRDGRDVMVSYYYHCVFLQENGYNWLEVKQTSRDLKFLDPQDIKKNLPEFIEYTFTVKRHPKFSWVEFCTDWVDKGVPLIRYEDMLKDTNTQLQLALNGLGFLNIDQSRLIQSVNVYQFEKQAGRPVGIECPTSFLRKGVAGDWRNKFSKEAREIFNYFAGETLIHIGYEDDDSWINL